MDTHGDVFNLTIWDQWWVAGKATFPGLPQVPDAENPYAQDEPQLQDFGTQLRHELRNRMEGEPHPVHPKRRSSSLRQIITSK
jgi:hypothetical protein